MTTFFHISDLHLGYTRWDSWSKYAAHYPDPDELKRRCLDELERCVRICKPDFLFITGDISECQGRKQRDEITAILDFVGEALEPLRQACATVGTKIIAITGDHDLSVQELVRVVPEARQIGEVVESQGLRIGCLGCRPKQVGSEEEVKRLAARARRLDAVIMHSEDDRTLPEFSQMGLSYLGIGHGHVPFWEQRNGFTVGRPGHLYSYWDGPDGKAWPTGFISGQFESGEPARIDFRPFKSVPRTLRFSWGSEGLRLRGLLSGEAGELGFREIPMQRKDHWSGVIFDGLSDVGEGTARDLVRAVVESRNHHIFTAKESGNPRIVKYGHELLEDEQTFDRALSYWFSTD